MSLSKLNKDKILPYCNVKDEAHIHGKMWEGIHGGYFSAPSVAEPLLKEIISKIIKYPPDIIADLGGGTGWLLKRVIEALCKQPIDIMPKSFLNIDCSKGQIEDMLTKNMPIVCILKGIMDITREDLFLLSDNIKHDRNGAVFFIMRSVLHYFGRDGIDRALSHIRSCQREGEFFIHQTASFSNTIERDCLNMLYEMMGTDKYYFTQNEILRCLKSCGWHVERTFKTAPLPLTAEELSVRYRLDNEQLEDIKKTITKEFGHIEGVFECNKKDITAFVAYLHYYIYVCRVK